MLKFTRYIPLFIIIFQLLCSCKTDYIRIEEGDRLEWRKKHYKKNNVVINSLYKPSQYKNELPTEIIQKEDIIVYEFDSIRVYVDIKDTVLNILTAKGFIRGQYFFQNYKGHSSRKIIIWPKPIKSKENGWYGYHFHLQGAKELKISINRLSKKAQKNLKQDRLFNIRCNYYMEYYVATPDIFRIELQHNTLTNANEIVKFVEFIEDATTTQFYHSGVEI